MARKSDLERVRDYICEAFGEYLWAGENDAWTKEYDLKPIDEDRVRALVERDTYTGEDDPGGWAPGARVVIHCERGIPSGYYDEGFSIMERWDRLCEKVKGLHAEHVNAGVIGVYKS